MARFLRDEQISNLTIDSAAIRQLVEVLSHRGEAMPEFVPPEEREEGQAVDVYLYYTIRFDEKGNRAEREDELLRYFEQATDVERLIFELKSGESLRTNLLVGSYLDLRLDKNEGANRFLTVSSDDEDWVNASFTAVKEVLSRHKNRNSWIRNPWIVFMNQIISLFLGFAVALWAASGLAPNLTIENAFLISFLMVLLVFSNMWAPISQKLAGLALKVYPPIKFYRPKQDKFNWLYQAVVTAVVGAAVLYFLGMIITYVGEILGGFINSGSGG